MTKIRNYAVGDEPVPGYRLLAFLGSGNFGDVWKSTAPGGTLAALKIINLEMKGALKELRSLRLVKKISYPNLVSIQAIWLKDAQGNVLAEADFENVSDATRSSTRGTMLADTVQYTQQVEPAELIYAMSLGQKSLAERLDECRKQNLPGIPIDELLNYMQDAARAIDYLNSPQHELGAELKAIQHCDIKPPNILIIGDAAQVCDFSLARDPGDMRKTSLGLTVLYAAPEVIESNSPSPTTDQYSLAVSYVELRTGEVPFPPEATASMVMQAHLNSNLDLSGLPPAEQEVIRRATARKPKERFASCSELVLALRQAVRPKSVSTGRPTWPWLAAACLALVVPIAVWKYAADKLEDLPLPQGFVAAEGFNPVLIHPGLQCPDQIICTWHGMKVPFRLVYGSGIPTFYMMENKVSRSQFGRFARENPDKVKDSKWEADECDLPPTLSASDREQLPVFNVTCAEASFFARWLASESGEPPTLGELPTVDQWDAAAGFVKGQKSPDSGPFLPWDATKPRDEQVAVNRGTKGPLPVGHATHDISFFGCRDMAGNGYEWTFSPTNRAGKFDPKVSDERTSMVLRGHAYADDNPLRFSELEDPDSPNLAMHWAALPHWFSSCGSVQGSTLAT